MDSRSDSERNVLPNEDPLLLVSGLLEAVTEMNLQKVKYLVHSGKSVNVIIDQYGNSPLHVAAMKDDLEIIDYLLAQDNIVVNIRNLKGETPLYQAVQYGGFESSKRLIQKGADINLPNKNGVTPLHISVTYIELALLLVLHNAHIDAVDNRGDMPLHYAINGCLDTLHMLLFFNADANSPGYNNITPFMKALLNKQVEIQRVLLDYVVDFNATMADGTATLSLALANNSPFLTEIIQKGAEVNYVNNKCNGLYGLASCTFMFCLYAPNHRNFQIIWDRLKFNADMNYINLCVLFKYLGPSNLEKYIDVIIESDNMQIAVNSLMRNRNYFVFINKFVESKLKLEQLTKLTCRLILYGYRVTSYDIHIIFQKYGYCELFRMLLYMENDYTCYGWLPHMVLPRLICVLDYKLNNVVDLVVQIDTDAVPKLLQYFNYPPLMNRFRHRFKKNPNIKRIIKRLPIVPLLLEMARDKAREHIAKTFKARNACEFYTIVNCLEISTVYKKILTYEKKLYNLNL